MRQRLFVQLATILQRAKYVVALDADLGWVTLITLSRMMAPSLAYGRQVDLFDPELPVTRLWLNTQRPGVGKSLELFRSKTHLIADLMQSAAEGKRIFGVANSKALIEQLSAMIADKLPHLRQLVLTAETTAGEDQERFLKNPQVEALKYDVILASPAVGTGIDITFPDKAKLIDVVYGFCEPNITTHFDFDQQLARVRDPGSLRVWVSPRRYNFETNIDVVRRDLLERGAYKSLLVDYKGAGGAARYIDDDPMIEMAALIGAQQRTSKNALRDHFVAHRQAQGYTIEFIDDDDGLKAVGKDMLADAKEASKQEYAERVVAATPICARDFDRIMDAIEEGEVVTEDERWRVRRRRLEVFYRKPISPELVKLDDRGRYRGRVRLLGEVEKAAAKLPRGGAHDALPRAHRFVRSWTDTAAAIVRLLQLTPVMRGSRWNTVTVFDADQLTPFVQFATANKAAVENLLGIEVRADMTTKPMSQLTAVLRLIGLGLVKAGTKKIDGRKVYGYRLDADALQRAQSILSDRAGIREVDFMALLHGFDVEEEDWAASYIELLRNGPPLPFRPWVPRVRR